ncbi:hypothetical protein ACFVY9_02955 [Streptomyces sp. NPDC059544]|uniref:hypothetical protein n=1 Tax=Streptomyces sp. NPDC059544 TaxID=3346861 RepID=UPI003689A34E
MSEDLTRADGELLQLRASIHAAVGNDCQIQHRLDEFERAVEKRAAEWLRTQGTPANADLVGRLADTLDPDSDDQVPPWRPSRRGPAVL